jgi:hypothetical protein
MQSYNYAVIGTVILFNKPFINYAIVFAFFIPRMEGNKILVF